MKSKNVPLVLGLIIVVAAGYMAYQYWLMAFRYEQDMRLIPTLLIGIFATSGIFIALRQNWARKVAIGYAILQIVISTPILAIMLVHVFQDLSKLPKVFGNVLVPLVALLCYISVVIILTRPTVKKEFLPH